MTLKLAVVYEADADFRIATELADRVIVAEMQWLDADLLPSVREWVRDGMIDGSIREFRWGAIKQLTSSLRIRVHGHFDQRPALPDASAARRAIAVIVKLIPDVSAIVFMRDTDKQIARARGLDQARQLEFNVPIVIGAAIPEREAWVICGFEPLDSTEEKLLQQEHSTLGFDPRFKSHNLMATNDDQAKRSPKRVVKALTGDSVDREQSCWRETSLATLMERGKKNGLADYLAEITSKVAPLIGGTSKP